jgi:hypothetical protein
MAGRAVFFDYLLFDGPGISSVKRSSHPVYVLFIP